MDDNSLPALVEEVKVWARKLSTSCAEVVGSLEKIGSSDEDIADSLRKGCGAVATSMTQLVAFCHKAQKAASSVKDAGSFVATMNGFVVACIALTKGLIKMAKTAMAKKNTAMSEIALAEARSLLADLQKNCNKIARCAGEVIARSPRQERRGSNSSESISTSPERSPRFEAQPASFEVDRQVVSAIKEVMEKKEVLTRAIHRRDAVEFVSKAKELVTSFSALKKATLRHSKASSKFEADNMSTALSSYVQAAKSHFQAPADGALHNEYDKRSANLNSALRDLATFVKNSRASLAACGQAKVETNAGTAERPFIKNPKRASVAGTISLSSSRITITRVAATSERVVKESQPLKEEPKAEEPQKKAEKPVVDMSKEDIGDMMARQIAEEEERVEAELRLKKEAERKREEEEKQRALEKEKLALAEEKKRREAEEKKRKEEEEEKKRKEEEGERKRKAEEEERAAAATEKAAVAEAEAEAAAIAAIEAGFEEAEKNARSPPLMASTPRKEDSAKETDDILQSMLPPGGEKLSTTATAAPEKPRAPAARRTSRPRLASAASREEAAKAAALAAEQGGGDVPALQSSAEIATKNTEAAVVPAAQKNIVDKTKTGADVAIGKLMDIYPQFKEIFESSARAPMVKDIINDALLLVDTVNRNVTVTGRGGDECRKASKAMTTVMVAVYCYMNGLDSSAKGSDDRRAHAVKDSRTALLRTLLVVLDAIGDHARDTVPSKIHSQSVDHLTNIIVNAVEKGSPAPDEHVLNACRVHTVGLIESQLRESLLDLTKALHGKTVQLLHTMKIVFSGAMVEFNAWVEFCAVFPGVVSQLEAVIGCTETLAEVVRQRRTNFSRFSSTEELDVEELVNIFIWNEGDSPPPKTKIKLGTLNQLVSYLTSDQKIDSAFLRTFVCTYRSFSTPVQLLEKLQERFSVPPHVLIGREEAIQLRVCVTLKYWVQNQFPDFDDALILRLFEFLNQVEDAGHSAMADGIRQQLKEKMEERASQMHSRGNLLPSPLVISSSPSLVSDYLERHSPQDVAKQLTLIDFSIFSLIRPAELMNQAWTSKKLSHRALHVCTFMNRVNNLSNWVATLVLSRRNLASRIKTMQFLIEVAVHLRAMNSYHSLMGIVAGTSVSAVSRLKHTKDGLGKDVTKKMASLEQLMHPSGSFKHYRKQLAASKYPVIPYLGVYLTDLVFIEDGNPDEVDGFINFEKRELAFAPVQAVQTAQGEGYSFPKCEPLYSTLLNLCQLDEELLWMLSQAAEPRNCQSKDIK